MNQLLKAALVIAVILASTIGYGQSSAGGNAAKQSRMKYAGTEDIKSILKKGDNTTFTRYFRGGFELDSTRSWSDKIIYTGTAIDDKTYEFKSKRYKRDPETNELTLNMETTKTYIDKKIKGSELVTKQFLVDGLVEQITYKGEERTVRCFDKEKKELNQIGCLVYTYTKYPKEKMIKLSANLQDQIIKTIKKNRGIVPSYILMNIESDYKTQQWNLSLDFPKNYDIDSNMYAELVTTIMNVLSQEKLQDYHFNKDINGNYYNHYLNIPISFNKR
ncbi:hypothetical protein HX052_01865 [Myroides marinus]|uniref:hypothetical protein n=1 Tax=Myroides marinus TaxID=703342 RepID=UPI00257860B5|nr:hypothetical protein [Myroides marinus]MDM1388723.1 hypothetical protein [Myroides marinus]